MKRRNSKLKFCTTARKKLHQGSATAVFEEPLDTFAIEHVRIGRIGCAPAAVAAEDWSSSARSAGWIKTDRAIVLRAADDLAAGGIARASRRTT
jgi:hypothetical protein